LYLKSPRKIDLDTETHPPVLPVPEEILRIIEQDRAGQENDGWWAEDDNESLLPATLLNFLRTLRALLMKFDQWAIEPHEIASSRLMVLEDDLHQLKHYTDSIHHSLGTPVTIQGTDFPDVWCALEFLSQSASGQDFGATVAHVQHSLFNLAQQVGEVQNGFKSIQSLVHALPAAQEQLSQLAVQLHLHEKRFTLIQPLLLSIPKLSEDIAALKTTTCVSTDPWTANFAPQPHVIPPSPSGSTPVESTVDAITRLNTIEHAIQSLEKRVVGDGIKIGRFLFQSKEDLRLWFVTNVPSNRFGLFLDAVSIFDFLAQPHLDSQENMAQLYNSQKNGFDTTYESRIISSMQNLFPNLFGKSASAGMDTALALPGFTKPEQWNNKGVTGLQLQVERELPNVDLQFRHAIASSSRLSS